MRSFEKSHKLDNVCYDIRGPVMDEASRMEYRPDLKAYTLRLHLKQGYYSYQLLFLPVGETEGSTGVLEGDYFETTNQYTAFVYYRGPNDRYDRLAAIGRYR